MTTATQPLMCPIAPCQPYSQASTTEMREVSRERGEYNYVVIFECPLGHRVRQYPVSPYTVTRGEESATITLDPVHHDDGRFAHMLVRIDGEAVRMADTAPLAQQWMRDKLDEYRAEGWA